MTDTRKRKAARQTKTKSRKSKRTKNFHDDGPSRLLELPAELRNTIYAYAAEGRTAYLKKGQRQLTDNSPLLATNHQLREEYTVILLLYAKTIKAEVIDFDFRHIVTFLNNLSTGELNALPNITGPQYKDNRNHTSHLPEGRLGVR